MPSNIPQPNQVQGIENTGFESMASTQFFCMIKYFCPSSSGIRKTNFYFPLWG
jgi:hypothetical protein